MRLGEFLVERNLALDPARRERQNDEMPLDPPVGVADDGLPESDQFERRNFEAGFLADLAYNRFFQGFAKLDAAARKRIEAMSGRPAAPHDQHAAVAKYRRTDRQIRSRWISPFGGAVAH